MSSGVHRPTSAYLACSLRHRSKELKMGQLTSTSSNSTLQGLQP